MLLDLASAGTETFLGADTERCLTHLLRTSRPIFIATWVWTTLKLTSLQL